MPILMTVEGTNLSPRVTQFLGKLDPIAILQAGWVAHVPFWLNILFIVLLAKSLAGLTWFIFMPVTDYKVVARQPVPVNQSQATARLSSVSRLHLFGLAQGKSGINPVNIAKTKLQLVLKGVFASTNPVNAYAIISESASAKGRTFNVGERLPSGAVLHEVRPTEVILNRNGRLESLALPQKQLDTIPIASSSSSTRRSVRTMPVTNRLKKIRQTFVKSPQSFMENARLEPVVNKADGSTEGFTFNHNDPMVMRSLGLLPTDVITAINGTSISNSMSAAYDQLLNSLKNGTPLSIDFKRKGIPQTVNVQM
ncbi:hypothetical protein MNBD_GAMMA23-132 [hydrothermal vent metagenome]|uniref:Type II secretion system protein GspC N-terminal domain-containing protein n=1 Tax=hydrothermal vent metagenome TaxID=652676 RepID=A0A3B1AD97_9ZZZZ